MILVYVQPCDDEFTRRPVINPPTTILPFMAETTQAFEEWTTVLVHHAHPGNSTDIESSESQPASPQPRAPATRRAHRRSPIAESPAQETAACQGEAITLEDDDGGQWSEGAVADSE